MIGAGQLGTPLSQLGLLVLGAPASYAAVVDYGPIAPHAVISLDLTTSGTIALDLVVQGSLILDQ